jgi:dehydrogenase/reductase SDR family member 12
VTRLNERIRTSLPIEEAFAYLADFANSEEWDPGVDSARRVGDGPVGVGARYQLGVRQGDRVVPMEYRITQYEPPSRVVLVGSGSGIQATDEIRFEPKGDETVVDYTADIVLTGVLRLVQPFLGGTFRKIAENASDGIERTLAARAAVAGSERT